MTARTSLLVVVAVLVASACGEVERANRPWLPRTFKLMLNTGVGLELMIQAPFGYRAYRSEYQITFGVSEPHYPDVVVGLDDDEKLEHPCGIGRRDDERFEVARRSLRFGFSVLCEERDTLGKPRTVQVVRVRRNIDVTLTCALYPRSLSDDDIAAARAVCESLEVVGRSEWTDADTRQLIEDTREKAAPASD